MYGEFQLLILNNVEATILEPWEPVGQTDRTKYKHKGSFFGIET